MCKEGAGDVPPPLLLCQPALAARPARSREQRSQRQVPQSGELARKLLGSVVSALEPAIRIARDERDACDVRARHRLAYDRSGPARQPAQPSLLPGGHD
jgi:hypothetical protein